jgi:hypothetical protein
MSTFDELMPGELIQWIGNGRVRRGTIVERTEIQNKTCLIVRLRHKNNTDARSTRRVFRNNYPLRWCPNEAAASAVIQG